MNDDAFRALVLRQENEQTRAAIETLQVSDLPDADVLVDVGYSSLNYKDAMAITGAGPIVRTWPMVPGIDLVGTVRESDSNEYTSGDQVVLTGWGVGEKYWGGYAERARLKSEWLVPLPANLSARNAMAIGTAGLTAMLCVMRLQEAGIRPEQGPVLVTGSSGGVGSVAVALLAALGYSPAALTTATDSATHDYLRELGATEIVAAFDPEEKAKPLEKQVWAGAIDTVGSTVLARVLGQIQYGGAVAACGLAAGPKLPTTVMPFILRNVGLLGVDSVMCPRERRITAWQRLADELPMAALDQIGKEVSLDDAVSEAEALMAGRIEGRVIIRPTA